MSQLKIQELLDANVVDDLMSLINRRKLLNTCNMSLIYLFHVVQSAGILTTTIATSYNAAQIVWVGVGLNFLASLISIFEKTNTNISAQLLADIKAIKDGTYVDERAIVDPSQDTSPHPPSSAKV